MGEKVSEKWKEKANITYEQLFNPWWAMPHPGLFALLKRLESEIGRERTMQLIKETTERLIKDDPKKGTQRVNSEDPETVMAELIKWTNIFSESVQHILDFEILPSSLREYKLRVTKCLYAKTVRDMDAADLGYQWICYNDYVIAEILHPKIKLTRRKTLMQGDDCCEFHYTFEDNKISQ